MWFGSQRWSQHPHQQRKPPGRVSDRDYKQKNPKPGGCRSRAYQLVAGSSLSSSWTKRSCFFLTSNPTHPPTVIPPLHERVMSITGVNDHYDSTDTLFTLDVHHILSLECVCVMWWWWLTNDCMGPCPSYWTNSDVREVLKKKRKKKEKKKCMAKSNNPNLDFALLVCRQ
jgi:hypothetical protein